MRKGANDDGAVAADNLGEWLSLSLGRNDLPMAVESNSPSKPASSRVFSCNFCMRTLFSSQALGGHQNAHKREQGATRRLHSQRDLPMMGLPLSAMVQTGGVQPHSLEHTPSTEGTRMALLPFKPGGAIDLRWPENFHINSQLPNWLSQLLKLDLDLRL